MTPLDRYWPAHDEINRCIKTEAETASEAVLLAVHQPTPLSVRNAGSPEETPTTEQDMLDAFLTSDLPEGTLLLSVTGASGAGKSHVIRWLAAQLQRDPRAQRMTVIRIPKSASLRTVVELIIQPLAHDPRYADALRELQKAVSSVTPGDGAVRLAGGLELALGGLARRLHAQLQTDRQSASLKQRLDHAQKLHHYFNDPALRDHFVTGVLARIVERSVIGRTSVTDEVDALPQFTPDDLVPPPKIEEAARTVQSYYRTVLNREDGKGFGQAAMVLNEIIDEAIRDVFRLGQAMGGVTLEDIILRIREILLEDDRELVLLIEDFAALSGIHEILLRVCIQEAVRDGVQVRARMRTALAVTDGYLTSRDTILTRAKREWIVRTRLDTPEDVVSSSVNLVGAYLNAARWGEENLIRMFRERSGNPGRGLTDWISVFEDEDRTPDEADMLSAFGANARGEPLFPFNRVAIRSLVERHLTVGGRIEFRPRSIINYILRDVLLKRDEFANGRFPLVGFQGATPKADVAAWLGRLNVTQDVGKRIGNVLVLWGGNPETTTEATALSLNVFKAFSLPAPRDLGLEPTKDRGGGHGDSLQNKVKDRERQGNPAPQPAENPKIAYWRDVLEKWVAGTRIAHQDANVLRVDIAFALTATMDWNALCLAPMEVPSTWISIPNSLGEKSARYQLAIAEDHVDSDGMLRRTLLGLIRFHYTNEKRTNDRSWAYRGGDEDSALVANFVEGLAGRLEKLLVADAVAEIAPLSGFLVRQGRLLGLAPKRLNTPDGLAEALFSPAPERRFPDSPDDSHERKWQTRQKEAIRFRPEFQTLVKDRLGCFKGDTGKRLFAVDVVRLNTASVDDRVEIPKSLVESNSLMEMHATDMKAGRLQPICAAIADRLLKFEEDCRKAFGEDFGKQDFMASLKNLLTELEDASAWPGPTFDKRVLRDRIETFRSCPVMEELSRIRRLRDVGPERTLDITLECLGAADFAVVGQVRDFVSELSKFLSAAERKVADEASIGKTADAAGDGTELVAMLDTMLTTLDEFIKEEISV